MRDKAKHGTEKVQRTLRNRSLRLGIGLAVLFAFGLMSSSFRRVQTGFVRSYALSLLGGAALVVLALLVVNI